MNETANYLAKRAARIALKLGDIAQPIIDDYSLCLLIINELSAGRDMADMRKTIFSPKGARDIIAMLEENGILKNDKDIDSKGVFDILGKKTDDPHEVICSIDPFAYISHLSAMSYHGLTGRRPNTVFFTRPGQREWRAYAKEKMEKDYKVADGAWPVLRRVKFDRVRGFPVIEYSSIHPGAFKLIQGRKLRVSTIGRTFLDMVRKPSFCGGMRHVMEVFERFGGQYSNLIIDEIKQHGKKIEKVRAGYLLEEISGVAGNPEIEAWLCDVQRGGSRKLDPESEYRAEYSERWCLSLNV